MLSITILLIFSNLISCDMTRTGNQTHSLFSQARHVHATKHETACT
jgi:hypothetical protein